MVCVAPRRMLDYKQLGVDQNTIQKEYVKVCEAFSRFLGLAKYMFFIYLLSFFCGKIANILSYADSLPRRTHKPHYIPACVHGTVLLYISRIVFWLILPFMPLRTLRNIMRPKLVAIEEIPPVKPRILLQLHSLWLDASLASLIIDIVCINLLKSSGIITTYRK